jgi:hypothetical protein
MQLRVLKMVLKRMSLEVALDYARLRYPVLAFPFLNIRNLIGARGWSAIMKMMARRMR